MCLHSTGAKVRRAFQFIHFHAYFLSNKGKNYFHVNLGKLSKKSGSPKISLSI